MKVYGSKILTCYHQSLYYVYRISSIIERARSSELQAGAVFEGAFYSRARSIPFSLSVNNFFSKHNNFKFKGFIIMFSFFVTVAEGAEGPSSRFEVIGRELAELDEGRSQEAMDNFFA